MKEKRNDINWQKRGLLRDMTDGHRGILQRMLESLDMSKLKRARSEWVITPLLRIMVERIVNGEAGLLMHAFYKDNDMVARVLDHIDATEFGVRCETLIESGIISTLENHMGHLDVESEVYTMFVTNYIEETISKIVQSDLEAESAKIASA